MVGLVTSLAGGWPGVNLFVADLLADEPPGQFLLNLADFPALASVNGSVVLSLPGASHALAQIVVTRAANNQFYAVDSTCAHNQCTVPPFSAAEKAIVCSCHGSRYQVDGTLLGGPAQRGLRAFTATLDTPATLRITIPEFGFRALASLSSVVAGSRRLKLAFPALAFLTYQVKFRATTQAAWAAVAFARFSNGAFDSTELQGIGREEAIYVAAPQPTGFFSVVTI